MANSQSIKRNQERQVLESEVTEILKLSHQRDRDAEKTINVLKTMFDTKKEEELHVEFMRKYYPHEQV